MASTKQEVRDRAAEKLGIKVIGQTLQGKDVTRIEKAYDEVYQQLKESGLATWASTASVPDQLTPYVATLVAYNCIDSYGISDQRYSRILLDAGENGNTAKSNLRELITPKHESQSEPVYF